MGNSSEKPGGEVVRGEAVRGEAVRSEAPEPDSIRRLTACTCILAAAVIATLLALSLLRKDEAQRVVQASKLAQDGLERAIGADTILNAGNCALPAEEMILSPRGKERYSREVEITPASGEGGQTRVTVTVGWETIVGEAHVKMHGWVDAKESERVSAGLVE